MSKLHTCSKSECYNCSPDSGPCFCSKCSCGTHHVCVDCVNKFCRDDGLKFTDVYCTQCKKSVQYWYGHDLKYYPDDNTTTIYYENTTDDLDTACYEKNIKRIDWIMKVFGIKESTVGTCYVECIIEGNQEIADYLDVTYGIDDWMKAKAAELTQLSSDMEPMLTYWK